MKSLKEYICEAKLSFDIKVYKNKAVIKKFVKICEADDFMQFRPNAMAGPEIYLENFRRVLDAIDKDPDFADVIINGKFPGAIENNFRAWSTANCYNFRSRRIGFTASKYDKNINYIIMFGHDERFAESTYYSRYGNPSKAKTDCKIRAILRFYRPAYEFIQN